MLIVTNHNFGQSVAFRAALTPRDAMPPALVAELAVVALNASEPNVFYEGWFLDAALRHMRASHSVRMIEVRDNHGALIGVLPLVIGGQYGRMRVRHVTNWQHFHCFLGTPLIKCGAEAEFWHAVLVELDKSPWAQGFLTIAGMVDGGSVQQGLIMAARAMGRAAPIVHRYDRAVLASQLDAPLYLETHVRAKKRKELRRLANRLSDLGTVAFAVLTDEAAIDTWCADFLALEAAGWKGERGAALGKDPATSAFFCAVVRSAFDHGKLDFQQLTLDGRPIAMLVNFRTPPGSWSFKIAYDESLARFSPGVLIELENLAQVLGDPEIEWMDSCAVENHSMINSLWAERRTLVQMTVALRGVRRGLTYRLCRAAETTSAHVRRLRR